MSGEGTMMGWWGGGGNDQQQPTTTNNQQQPTTNNNPCSGMNDHPRRDTDLSYTRIETSGSCLQVYMGFMIF